MIMENFGALLSNRPHDAYFEQVFKVLPVKILGKYLFLWMNWCPRKY